MPEIPQSATELAEVLTELSDLNFELPDPEDEEVSEHEFADQVDTAWKVCDRFDLQTEIWRGRILRAVRDREKRGGEGRGMGFLHWLKQREISKSQAYALIELANSADALLAQGHLNPDAINNFSKRAFIETAKSSPEVQQMVSDVACAGDRITRREVRQLADEWTAMSSDLVPDDVREKAAIGAIPPRYLAPLVREMEKLPDTHVGEIQREMVTNPDVDTVRQLTSDARSLAKYLDAAAQVQALNQSSVDLEMALEEALRVGCLSTASDLVKQATQLEQTIVKLHSTWRRVGSLADRLYVDTGASTPHLRSLLNCLEQLAGQVIEVNLGDSDDGKIRLQILSD
ncbi:MAG: hypothetical protein P5702_16445 [Limnospira sp. PMC 1291.21]|uniref:Uncharacterized protein n=3 Tax=Limnospira TaxID=2596745 RepID=A0A9P1KGC4_9CYAN|nr:MULTISPECIES: hypothetical protein [Limnospira]EKD06928.1 hypothetical protein SPLC1_S510410 [Arthrospira platensis C1]MBD2713329.1 hypothetical protein [Arthrospira platensis FACHB-835]MDC0838738.1 hypothetical protein [Limnoraphis robusta]MDY7054906.1 hypothetical protein [Limnospira fusiformis LS22]QJB26172.1 hypothetical protein HFV01_10700 [Limnospira fusiformis SAG 85.79]QQW28873.1 hypothetical protein AP9108_29310 [Arthrospira sp. PCC 9108]